jgi:hypothetical protein
MQTASELEGRSLDWLGKLKAAGEVGYIHLAQTVAWVLSWHGPPWTVSDKGQRLSESGAHKSEISFNLLKLIFKECILLC